MTFSYKHWNNVLVTVRKAIPNDFQGMMQNFTDESSIMLLFQPYDTWGPIIRMASGV